MFTLAQHIIHHEILGVTSGGGGGGGTATGLALPYTTSSVIGVITAGTVPWMHNFTNPAGFTDASINDLANARNLFLGFMAGNFAMAGAATEGKASVGLGHYALSALTTGNQLNAVGWAALGANTFGSYNNAFGSGALEANISGVDLVAFGQIAGATNTTGNQNTFIGSGADSLLGTESNAIAIGYQASVDADNKTVIGNLNTTTAWIWGQVFSVTPGPTTVPFVTGTGTDFQLPLWTNGANGILGDSPVSYDGTNVISSQTIRVINASNAGIRLDTNVTGVFTLGITAAGAVTYAIPSGSVPRHTFTIGQVIVNNDASTNFSIRKTSGGSGTDGLGFAVTNTGTVVDVTSSTGPRIGFVVRQTATWATGAPIFEVRSFTDQMLFRVAQGVGGAASSSAVTIPGTLDVSGASNFTGVATFSAMDVHNAGVSLGTSGLLQSDEVDGGGQPAFDFVVTQARTSDPLWRMRSSSTGLAYFTVAPDGTFGFGPAAVAGFGTVLSFNVNDGVSLPTGTNWSRGISSILIHSLAGTAPSVTMNGIQGGVSLVSGANSGALDVAGLVGINNSDNDVATLAGKTIAGVAGVFKSSSGTSPFSAQTGTNRVVAGNWTRAAALYGAYFNMGAAATAPTNLPGIICGVYAAIPAPTAGEAWGVETDAPSTGKTQTPAVSGAIKLVFPVRGTRQTHAYIVPTAGAAGGPTGNASGDVYFDLGTNNPIGLAQHNGTNWQWFLTPTMNANGAIAAGNAGTVTGLWQFDHLQTCTFDDAKNITFNTGTGTKIGTATGEKLSLWNAAPNVQPTNAIAAAAFVANTSGIVDDSATFGTYTIGQIVAALKRLGALA